MWNSKIIKMLRMENTRIILALFALYFKKKLSSRKFKTATNLSFLVMPATSATGARQQERWQKRFHVKHEGCSWDDQVTIWCVTNHGPWRNAGHQGQQIGQVEYQCIDDIYNNWQIGQLALNGATWVQTLSAQIDVDHSPTNGGVENSLQPC